MRSLMAKVLGAALLLVSRAPGAVAQTCQVKFAKPGCRMSWNDALNYAKMQNGRLLTVEEAKRFVDSCSGQLAVDVKTWVAAQVDTVATCTQTATGNEAVAEDGTACDDVTALADNTACAAVYTKASTTDDTNSDITDVAACTYATEALSAEAQSQLGEAKKDFVDIGAASPTSYRASHGEAPYPTWGTTDANTANNLVVMWLPAACTDSAVLGATPMDNGECKEKLKPSDPGYTADSDSVIVPSSRADCPQDYTFCEFGHQNDRSDEQDERDGNIRTNFCDADPDCYGDAEYCPDSRDSSRRRLRGGGGGGGGGGNQQPETSVGFARGNQGMCVVYGPGTCDPFPEANEHEEWEGGLFVVFIQLFFPGVFIGIWAIGACVFRSKSMGKAPFNGEPVKKFERKMGPGGGAVTMGQSPAQIIAVQVPAGSKAGDPIQAMHNGMAFQVVIPDGVAEGQVFNVQAPVVPVAAVAVPVGGAVINPLNAGGDLRFADFSPMDGLAGVYIEQAFDVMEAFSGCEMKNRYRVHRWSQEHGKGDHFMWISEDSSGCERQCCRQLRHLTFYLHDGQDERADVIAQYHKSFTAGGPICCCRPDFQMFDGDGTKLGHINDPWRCCTMNNIIYGADGQGKYEVSGSVCQAGLFCPCLGDVAFDLTSTSGDPTTGEIRKTFNGCAEMMAKVNTFECEFPNGATIEDKIALIGSTMLIDMQFFEKK